MVPIERSFSLDLKNYTEATGRGGEIAQSKCRIGTPEGSIDITGTGPFILNVLTDLLSSRHGYSREEIAMAWGHSGISGDQVGIAVHMLLAGTPLSESNDEAFTGAAVDEESIDGDELLSNHSSATQHRRRGRPRKNR